MAWSADFQALLAGPNYRPRFIVEVLEALVGTLPGTPGSWGPDGIAEVQTLGDAVEPVTWRSSLGGFSFTYLTENPAYFIARVRRGSWVALRCGLGDLPEESWPVVCVGRVESVSPRGKAVQVRCLSLYATLACRPSRADSTELPLFCDLAGAGSETDLAADFSVGNTTLYVDSIGTFQKDSSASTHGLMRITPSSGGEAFFLRWSAKTSAPAPDEFTVEADVSLLGVTVYPAASGDPVEHLAYIVDHPVDIVRKILASTGVGHAGGAGDNGAYDTLPAEWGYGVPDQFIDHGDCGKWKALLQPASGNYYLNLYSDVIQANAFEWLSSVLSPYGIFITTRQGALTIRCGVTPWGQPIDETITDDDIAEIVSHELYDPALAAQPAGVEVLGPSSPGTAWTQLSTRVSTLPAYRYQTYDCSLYTHTNEDAILDEVLARLYKCALIGERLVLRCAGLRLAGLACWDHVRVTSAYLVGRLEAHGDTYTDRPARVTRVTVDWMLCSVEVELWLPPHWEDRDR